MKKQILSILAVATMGLSLNAAVYATVNGDEVTDKDIQVLMSQMPAQMFQNGVTPEMQKRLIEQAVDQKLLANEALKAGIEKEKEFQIALDELKKTIALDVWMKKVYKNVKVDEKDIKAYFDKNKDKMIEPKRAKARHVLLKEEADAKDVIKALAGLKGDKLTEKFTALAQEKSIDPGSKNSGGQLGWFAPNRMVKEFADAAFEMTPGTVSKEPVKSMYGYHVILLEDKKGASKVAYKDAKAKIEAALRMEKFQKSVSAKAEELRKKAKIILK